MKHFKIIIAAIFIGFTLCSCEEEQKLNTTIAENTIVGEWDCIKYKDFYIFNKDHTGSRSAGDFNSRIEWSIVSNSYYLTLKTLQINNDGSDKMVEYRIIKITKRELVLQDNLNEIRTFKNPLLP